jgi:hypothetical protein
MKSLHTIVIAVACCLLSLYIPAANAQQDDEATISEAQAKADAIIKEAQEKAMEIEREAMRKAAQIEADATKKAAEIEAEAIRKAAAMQGQTTAAAPAPTVAGTKEVTGDRYPDINGVWSWKGNARNRKFELKYTPDGAVVADLYHTPRARHYREDFRYEDGVLKGNSYLTMDTGTRNTKKRYRYFQLEISTDGQRLEGYVEEWEEQGRSKERDDVVWERVGK